MIRCTPNSDCTDLRKRTSSESARVRRPSRPFIHSAHSCVSYHVETEFDHGSYQCALQWSRFSGGNRGASDRQDIDSGHWISTLEAWKPHFVRPGMHGSRRFLIIQIHLFELCKAHLAFSAIANS